MRNFDARKWFKKQYLAEDSLNDQAKRYFLQKVKRGEIDTLPENPKEEFLKQMMKDQMDHDEETLHRELNENSAFGMSPGEAVTELNFLMDELQNLSGEVKQIMRQTFPDEYRRGDAYGAFDFGSSRNQYDITFESILDSLASVGDEDEME